MANLTLIKRLSLKFVGYNLKRRKEKSRRNESHLKKKVINKFKLSNLKVLIYNWIFITASTFSGLFVSC